MTQRERNNLKIRTFNNLRTKYQLLFLNEFNFIGMDYAVDDYFMRKLLFSGKVVAFNLAINKQVESQLGFGSYSVHELDWKGDPIWINIVNEYSNPLIPKKRLKNNEDAVLLDLGFIPNAYINEYVARIIDIQETIDTNLAVNKMPFIVRSTNAKTIDAIKRLLENDQVIWTNDTQFEVMETKVPYIIDKLTLFKSETEAELLSVLGIDNVKFEKKAQMTKDEVNANDDEIDAYRKIIRQRIEKFFKQVNTVLGHNIQIEQDQDEIYDEEDNENDEGDSENDEEI